jgi:hypothetical protein
MVRGLRILEMVHEMVHDLVGHRRVPQMLFGISVQETDTVHARIEWMARTISCLGSDRPRSTCSELRRAPQRFP